jgi:glycosyltransferase involved in cell wall biosynthesis
MITFINYTSDISGSSVALFRLLDDISKKEQPFRLISSPGSWLYEKAVSKGWEAFAIDVPVLVKTINPVSWLNYLIRRKKLVKQLVLILNQESTPIVFINSVFNFAPLGLRKKIDKLILLGWIHELYLKPEFVLNFAFQIMSDRLDKIYCVSKPVMQKFSRKTFLLPNLIPAPYLASPHSTILNQATVPVYWCGSASPRKGLHLFPKLVRELQLVFPDIHFQIVCIAAFSGKKNQNYAQTQFKKIKEEFSEALVYQNLDQPWDYAKAPGIFLQTSLQPESFSLTVLEAMALGHIVISSNAGGVRDFGVHLKNLLFWGANISLPLNELQFLALNSAAELNLRTQAVITAREYTALDLSFLECNHN